MSPRPNTLPSWLPEPPSATATPARAYRAMAELLDGRPSRDKIDEALAILGRRHDDGAGPVRELRSALLEADPEALRAEWDRAFDRRGAVCAEPWGATRAWACVACELVPDVACATDLRVLAALTERVEWANRLGHSGLAAAVRERRADFLRHHADACLRGVSARARGAGPVVGAVARALDDILDLESRTLDCSPLERESIGPSERG